MITFKSVGEVVFITLLLNEFRECNITQREEEHYHLVTEANNFARNLFDQGHNSYDTLKQASLESLDIFLDLVSVTNQEMTNNLRSSIIKFYKIKYFHDFNNYVISMEEIIDITQHCLMDPIEKVSTARAQFHRVVTNFEDVRNFNTVDKCRNQLPDEVATAHCMLHQAVLFNETMQENLVSIVKIKTRQYALEVNNTIYNVQKCFKNFVPKFFDQLLVDVFTQNCGYLKIVSASVADLYADKWNINETAFAKKWGPLVKVLRSRLESDEKTLRFHEPLFLTLFTANLTSQDVVKTLYTYFVVLIFIAFLRSPYRNTLR